ncbi:PfkB family carbohydrate kinase [Aestuariimicrobium ganziense]|uniref:PfkB family carbohydrate kinase n=1 Tax=Aestuariimicrobium ganziense TaxID=2773677 RepID=UPI001944547D|nr:PfkB family carbohydrate kinase [Aestuariimicrobium ganziense]
MPRIIHTAQALVDEVAVIEHLPDRGGNVMASSFVRQAGGAVTILVAAARQGATCVHAGAHGTGPNGDLVRQVLTEAGVVLSAPPVDEVDTGVCWVMVEATAERTFVTTLGAERRISVESLATSAPVPGDLVCISGYTLAVEQTRDPLVAWLETLDSGVRVVLDPGAVFAELDDDLRRRVLARTAIWTGNAEESEALTGRTDMAEAAQAALDHLPVDAAAVVRDGQHGCAVAWDDQVHASPGFPQKPVDTNGAGDTHTGVLVAALAADLTWPEATRRANAAAAIKVTRLGPGSSPTTDEVDAFLAEHPA